MLTQDSRAKLLVNGPTISPNLATWSCKWINIAHFDHRVDEVVEEKRLIVAITLDDGFGCWICCVTGIQILVWQ